MVEAQSEEFERSVHKQRPRLTSPKITCGQHLPIRGSLRSSLDRRSTLRSLHVGSPHGEPFHSFTLIIHTWQGGVMSREEGRQRVSHFICTQAEHV